jgi:hypothetical protein
LKRAFISLALSFLILFSTFTVITPANSQQQVNLIVNGQFTDWVVEEDMPPKTPSYWVVYSGEVHRSGDAHSPPYSAYFNAYPGGGIAQSGSTTAGQHILRFWYKSSDWYGMRVFVSWWERKGKLSGQWSNNYAGPTGWTEITVSLDAPASTTMFTLGFEARDNDVLLDDVELFGPPPTPPEEWLMVDIWTNKGGQGTDHDGGTYTVGEFFELYFKVNRLADIEILLVCPLGERNFGLRPKVEAGTYTIESHVVEPISIGKSTYYIYARSQGLVSEDFVNIIVEKPFDFSISVEPSSQTIKQGESATFSVTVTSLTSSVKTVSLSLSGHHETMSYSFSPSSSYPTFTSTLTITTSTSTPVGSYTLTISGRDGGKTRSASVTFSVKEAISLEQLLKLAKERRDTYDALYKALDPNEVSIQIQDEYSKIYQNMWKDLYDVVESGDSPEAIVGIFELMLNALSGLDTMGKLQYLQNILLQQQFIQLRTYVGQMRDLTDKEIIALQHQDFNSLKSTYEQEESVLINIELQLSSQVKPFLDNLIRSWVESLGPTINQQYNIGGVDVGETNLKESVAQIDPDALYFNVYIIEKFSWWPPSWLFPKVGRYRVEIYDWIGQQIAQDTPSQIYRDHPPSVTQLQNGIANPTLVGAVQIEYHTLRSLINAHKLSLRLKIVCLQKPTDLFGWFSATPDILLFINMRSPSQPLNHPTTYETYAYENLNSIIQTLHNAANADQSYINMVKQKLG